MPGLETGVELPGMSVGDFTPDVKLAFQMSIASRFNVDVGAVNIGAPEGIPPKLSFSVAMPSADMPAADFGGELTSYLSGDFATDFKLQAPGINLKGVNISCPPVSMNMPSVGMPSMSMPSAATAAHVDGGFALCDSRTLLFPGRLASSQSLAASISGDCLPDCRICREGSHQPPLGCPALLRLW